MAYIGKVEISNEWQKVEDLVKEQVSGQSSFAFLSETKYQLQCEGDYGARLCNAESAPTEQKDGEMVLLSQTAIYEPELGAELYTRVHTLKPGFPCYLKISKIGD